MRRAVIKVRAAAGLVAVGVMFTLLSPQAANAATQMTATVGVNIRSGASTRAFSAGSTVARPLKPSAALEAGPRSHSQARRRTLPADTSAKGMTCRSRRRLAPAQSRSLLRPSIFAAAQACPIR